MKQLQLVVALIIATPFCVYAAGPDPGAVVVEWDRGSITVGDYVQWWQRIPNEDRPHLAPVEAKAEFLQSLINARLMLDEAESLGIDRHPDIVDWVSRRLTSSLKERLNAQATAGRVSITDDEIERYYERRLTQITARHIIVPTEDEARALIDSLEAGIPFEDLAMRYSTCASGGRGGSVGTVRYGDFSERWSEQAFQLEPGDFSLPFVVETGFAIIKVDDKALVEPPNPVIERQVIRKNLEKQKVFAETRSFRDSLRLAYDYDLNVEAVVGLCAGYAKEMMRLGITSRIVEVDLTPQLSEAELEQPVVTYRGGSFTSGEVVNAILSQPYVVRPNLDDPDEMISFIGRQMVDTLEVMEAVKRGLDKIPEIAVPLEKIKQKKTLQMFYRYVTRDAEVPDDVLRQYFDVNKEAYTLEAGHVLSKILVTSRPAVDSVMTLLDQGVPFEDIARERSADPFYAPDGGDMGFLPLGKDEEFDGFLDTMEVGQWKAFRSLEGFVVLWLRERRESRVPTLEEARDEVAKDLLPDYRDEILADWITAERERRGVKINASVLEQVDLGT
jgi:peptidyl-prolyl cis-trans isomerase C